MIPACVENRWKLASASNQSIFSFPSEGSGFGSGFGPGCGLSSSGGVLCDSVQADGIAAISRTQSIRMDFFILSFLSFLFFFSPVDTTFDVIP